jgi:TRAP-type C4-dicarboxylate transport system substrate-binding protein
LRKTTSLNWRIAEETHGRIKVKACPNAALGDEDALVEGLQVKRRYPDEKPADAAL